VTDSLDFDQVVSTCLDRLRTGDTVAACLGSYPSHARQLAPLLEVANLLQAPAGPTLSAEGLRAGEARLLAHATRLRARHRQAIAGRPRGVVPRLLSSGGRLAVASVMGALLLCGMLSAGTVSAAAGSLPGSPLYPVKQATETMVSWMAFTPQLRTHVHLAWAERRLREAEALMARDGAADESVLAAMEHETEQALVAAEQAGPNQLEAVAVHTEHQQTVLNRVLDKAPPAARPGLERALAASAREHARARSALDRAAPGKPAEQPPRHGTPPGQAGKDRPDAESATPTPEMEITPGVDITPEADTTETPAAPAGTVDELRPPNDGQGQGADSAPGEGPGQGHGQGKDQSPDHGQGQGQGKDKEDEAPKEHGRGKPK